MGGGGGGGRRVGGGGRGIKGFRVGGVGGTVGSAEEVWRQPAD